MTEYNVFLLNENGGIIDKHMIEAANDHEALAAAKQLVDGHDVEVWQGARHLTTLTRNSP